MSIMAKLLKEGVGKRDGTEKRWLQRDEKKRWREVRAHRGALFII